MIFIAANWGWILLLAFTCLLIAGLCQLRNIKNILNVKNANKQDPFKGILKGFIPVIVFSLLGSILTIVAIIGVIANLMH